MHFGHCLRFGLSLPCLDPWPCKYDFSAPPRGHTCSPIHGQGETSCMLELFTKHQPIPNTPNNMPTMPVLQYSTQFTERVKRVFSALRCQVMVARSCMRHHPLDCGDSSLPVRDLWPTSHWSHTDLANRTSMMTTPVRSVWLRSLSTVFCGSAPAFVVQHRFLWFSTGFCGSAIFFCGSAPVSCGNGTRDAEF